MSFLPLVALAQSAVPSLGEALSSVQLGLIAGVLLVAFALGLILFFVSRYKRCPANRVLVISGKVGGTGTARTISGGGAFVWPVIQEYAYMSLEPMQINIPLKDALSFENIRVAVPSVFTVAIGADDEAQANAATRLLGLTQLQIGAQAQDIIFGQLRQVIASMTIDQINRDRDAFLHKIQATLEPELKKIGLVLINVNIHDLRDESGYIEALGKKAGSQATQQARADVAEQEKIAEIRLAETARERELQVASANRLREVGLAEALRDRALRIAEIEREQSVGQQTAAFQQEVAVTEAQRAKRIAVATANADALQGEATAQAKIATTQSALAVQQAEATRSAEIARRETEGAIAEATNRAQARAAVAMSERVEAEQRAALVATANAEKARRIVEAEAAAETVMLAAEAEARATSLRLQAQATGEAAIIEERAAAIRKLIEAAGGDPHAAFKLMLVDQIPALAETAAKAISNIKFDKVVVWEGGNHSANGIGGTAGFVQNMMHSLPQMMQIAEEIGGVKLPNWVGTRIPEETNGSTHPALVVPSSPDKA